jgi:hypothetical protein
VIEAGTAVYPYPALPARGREPEGFSFQYWINAMPYITEILMALTMFSIGAVVIWAMRLSRRK